MKTIKLFFNSILLSLLITSCAYEDSTLLINDIHKDDLEKSSGHEIIFPKKIQNELIVLYEANADENKKKVIRDKYNINRETYQECNCSNKRIEKWTFPSQVNIEETKNDLSQTGGVEGVDYQFLYPNQNMTPVINSSNQASSDSLITSSIRPINNDNPTTIAIIDTGINLNVLDYTQPFLYNTGSNGSSCNDELSGWDFANNDNNTFDDNGHGTTVANIIMNELKRQSINNYQILPVKAFKKDGTGTTFDILCGYLYAVSKPEVSVVNMSFGWYRYPSDLLSKFIGDNSDILHLTSAGNNNNDNDDIYHFPSSISHNNVLSIGSYHKNNNYYTKSDFSNYGKSSVDILSKGENIIVPFYSHPPVNGTPHNTHRRKTNTPFYNQPVEGTSYAAPLVAAKAMRYYHRGHKIPYQVIQLLISNAQPINNGNIPDIRFGNKIIKP